MEKTSRLSPSLEDYLEAIYHIESREKVARASLIAGRMQVRGASVTGALQSLARKGLVNYAPYQEVTLTDKGWAAASEVVKRHQALHKFFVEVLDVEEETAQRAACRMEHSLPHGILDRLSGFVDFLAESGQEGGKLVEDFKSSLVTSDGA
ncbi:MAG TPA: metal-dependent transcriptional regulator [Candidatus Glassbacteria bacterium]|nr:metal-dependent transcriptional regulator [Candidatus Glassbacteria bacterium]